MTIKQPKTWQSNKQYLKKKNMDTHRQQDIAKAPYVGTISKYIGIQHRLQRYNYSINTIKTH